MSVTFEVSVQIRAEPISEFASKLEQALELPINPISVPQQERVLYRCHNSDHDAYFEVWKNPFSNDGELNFEDYNYVLVFRGLIANWRLNEQAMSNFAHNVFGAISKMRGYSAMLTYDVQILLANYTPNAKADD